jgi:hypothetical protein
MVELVVWAYAGSGVGGPRVRAALKDDDDDDDDEKNNQKTQILTHPSSFPSRLPSSLPSLPPSLPLGSPAAPDCDLLLRGDTTRLDSQVRWAGLVGGMQSLSSYGLFLVHAFSLAMS